MAQNEATLLIRIKQMGSEAIDKISENLNTLKQGAMVVGAAIVAFGVAAIAAFKESELASNKLTQAMITQGIYSTDLKKKYDEMATALQKKTIFADEEITAAQAVMQAYLGQTKISEKLMMATLDLASKTGSLESAATMVGKSIGTSTNALARQGIEVDANSTKSEKLAQVIQGLNGKFEGQAEAAAKGLGSLDQLKNITGDFAENAGKQLAPAVSYVASQLVIMFEKLNEGNAVFDMLTTLFIGAAKIVNGLGTAFFDLGMKIGGTLGIIAGATAQLMAGEFSQAKNTITSGFAELGKMSDDNKRGMEERMKALDDLSITRIEDTKAKELALENESAANKLAVKTEEANQSLIIKQTKDQEEFAYQTELNIAKQEAERGNKEALLNLEIAHQDKLLAAATNSASKVKILKDKQGLLDQKRANDIKVYEDKINKEKIAGYVQFLDGLATLSSSKNKAIAGIAKAAAIASATVNAYMAASNAFATVPYPASYAAAAGALISGFSTVAKIAGVQLAEGGIVKARPGGIQATIGEGGRDEAVIPLENGMIPGGGGGSTFIFNGPVMGDESQAMEFARHIDRSLLKLRQSNQSLAFDTGAI